MAFFHDSGDHSRESPSGKEDVELVGVRGVVDATLRLVFVDVVVDDVDGVKAAAPPTRLAAKITDNLIVYDMWMLWRGVESINGCRQEYKLFPHFDFDGCL